VRPDRERERDYIEGSTSLANLESGTRISTDQNTFSEYQPTGVKINLPKEKQTNTTEMNA